MDIDPNNPTHRAGVELAEAARRYNINEVWHHYRRGTITSTDLLIRVIQIIEAHPVVINETREVLRAPCRHLGIASKPGACVQSDCENFVGSITIKDEAIARAWVSAISTVHAQTTGVEVRKTAKDEDPTGLPIILKTDTVSRRDLILRYQDSLLQAPDGAGVVDELFAKGVTTDDSGEMKIVTAEGDTD